MASAGLRTMSAEEAKVHGWGTKVPSGIHGMIVSLVAAGFILVYFKEIIIPFVLAVFFVYLLRYGYTQRGAASTPLRPVGKRKRGSTFARAMCGASCLSSVKQPLVRLDVWGRWRR